MKKIVQKLGSCKRVLEVEVSPQEILSIAEAVYNDIKKVATIPGFRKGKVPLDMVKRFYQAAAEKEILQRSIPEFYQRAVLEESLFPIELPQIYDVSWQWGRPLLFKARFEVKPDFKLEVYKGLKLKKKKIEVEDEEIDKVLKNLQEKNAELIGVEPRLLEKGDFILSDYKSYVGDKVLEEKENVWLSLEENTNLAGFAEQLLGANIGEAKKISFEVPEDFPDKNLCSKKIDMEITIKEIKEKRLPPLNDEFAKIVGKFNSLNELREGIRRDLVSLKEIQVRKELEAKVLDLLLEANKFAVPASLVEKYAFSLEERFRQELLRKGLKKEEIEKSSDLVKKRAKEEAEKQVRIYFLLGEISQKENIEVTDEELDRQIKNLAEEWREDFEKVKKNFLEKKLLEELRIELREKKVLDFLIENAQIEED